MKGYYGRTPPERVVFVVGILTTSVLITWIYNHARRSVLAAILFHFMDNFMGEFLLPSLQLRHYSAVLWVLLVLGGVA